MCHKISVLRAVKCRNNNTTDWNSEIPDYLLTFRKLEQLFTSQTLWSCSITPWPIIDQEFLLTFSCLTYFVRELLKAVFAIFTKSPGATWPDDVCKGRKRRKWLLWTGTCQIVRSVPDNSCHTHAHTKYFHWQPAKCPVLLDKRRPM